MFKISICREFAHNTFSKSLLKCLYFRCIDEHRLNRCSQLQRLMVIEDRQLSQHRYLEFEFDIFMNWETQLLFYNFIIPYWPYFLIVFQIYLFMSIKTMYLFIYLTTNELYVIDENQKDI